MIDYERTDNLTRTQRRRLARFGVAECVDIHCHCLPGLDDGPETMDQAVDLCRALIADGVTTVIATPHQLGRYDGRNDPAKIRLAASALNACLLSEHMPLRVVPGADVRLDERIGGLLRAGKVMTLCDAGRYLLLELPGQTSMDLLPLLDEPTLAGVRVIVTHPERHEYLWPDREIVSRWLRRGVILQLTAGSLTGQFGEPARQAAWRWLAAGAALLVAGDAHDVVRRRPAMSQAIAAVASHLGWYVARRACMDNPLRVLRGLPILPAAESKGGQCA